MTQTLFKVIEAPKTSQICRKSGTHKFSDKTLRVTLTELLDAAVSKISSCETIMGLILTVHDYLTYQALPIDP